jgi:hypothetical protein
MSKDLRLDLGEPLVTDLEDYCTAKHRKKTQLIREILSDYLEKEMKNADTRKRVEKARAERTRTQSR